MKKKTGRLPEGVTPMTENLVQKPYVRKRVVLMTGALIVVIGVLIMGIPGIAKPSGNAAKHTHTPIETHDALHGGR